MSFIRVLLYFLMTVLLATVSLAATDSRPPAQVELEGAGSVRLAAHAARTHLLDALEIYTVAVYVNGSMDRTRLASPDVVKAVRIDVTYVEELQRRVLFDWRGELIPRLDQPATAHLRGVFAPLRQGDVVLIEYVPAKGTTVRVNKSAAVFGANHDLMLAFLDHWLGQRPVSEEIRRLLLAGV